MSYDATPLAPALHRVGYEILFVYTRAHKKQKRTNKHEKSRRQAGRVARGSVIHLSSPFHKRPNQGRGMERGSTAKLWLFDNDRFWLFLLAPLLFLPLLVLVLVPLLLVCC